MEILHQVAVPRKYRLKPWQKQVCRMALNYRKVPELYAGYHGRMMNITWMMLLWQSQQETAYAINDDVYERIPLGSEDASHTQDYCPRCQAARGKLHLRKCDREQCPRCRKFTPNCQCTFLD